METLRQQQHQEQEQQQQKYQQQQQQVNLHQSTGTSLVARLTIPKAKLLFSKFARCIHNTNEKTTNCTRQDCVEIHVRHAIILKVIPGGLPLQWKTRLRAA